MNISLLSIRTASTHQSLTLQGDQHADVFEKKKSFKNKKKKRERKKVMTKINPKSKGANPRNKQENPEVTP